MQWLPVPGIDLFSLGDAMPICHARTPEEISAQLERLVFDPQEREQVGKAGREYVEKYTNIDQIAQNYLTLFETALTESGRLVSSRSGIYSYYLQQRYSLLGEVVQQISEMNKGKSSPLSCSYRWKRST
jgi:hypothetical protein